MERLGRLTFGLGLVGVGFVQQGPAFLAMCLLCSSPAMLWSSAC